MRGRPDIRAEEGTLSMGADPPISHHPATHYDKVHGAWRLIMGEEFHYGYFSSPDAPLERATAELTRRMLDGAQISAGDRVLDVGCGTGRQSCDLAERFHSAVLGITTSASGVSAANSLAAERAVTQARFQQRDGTNNGLPAESFDVVWVLESSHLMRDRDALLRECVRVLVPGGRLVLCDIIRRREIPFAEIRARRKDFATLRAAFGDAHMESLERYVSMLEALGARVTERADISQPTLPTFAAWRANVDAHYGALEPLMGAEWIDDFVRSTHILEAFWRDGTLGYGILAALKPVGAA
jgi:27-O-demethylrifamycin SV methyltransferase